MSGTSEDSTVTARRLLQSEVHPSSFLETNMAIFILIGAFLLFYILVTILHKNMDSICLSCPKLNFYTT